MPNLARRIEAKLPGSTALSEDLKRILELLGDGAARGGPLAQIRSTDETFPAKRGSKKQA